MKLLVLHYKDSYYKFDRIYDRHLFEVSKEGHFLVHQRNSISGDEKLVAWFKDWDYFVIEEDIE